MTTPRHLKLAAVLILAGMPGITIASQAASSNWEKHCSSCHGPDGKGKTRMGQRLKIKDLTDPAFQASFTDDQAFKAIKEGLKDETGKTKMKPIEDITDDEARTLVAHVRALAAK